MSTTVSPQNYTPAQTTLQLLRRFATMHWVGGDNSQSILPWLPRPLRWFLLFVLLLNSRSFPFVWHLRVFRRPIFSMHIHAFLLKLRSLLLFHSSSKRNKEIQNYYDSLCPLAMSPVEIRHTYVSRATPDDCDFRLHLSNSSYAKNLDIARLGFTVQHYSEFFRDGGWIPLAGATYYWAREVGMGEKYQVRTYICAWDSKWVYMIGKFVSHDKYGSKHSSKSGKTDKIKNGQSTTEDNLVLVDKALLNPNNVDSFHTILPIADVDTVPSPSLLPSPSFTPGTATPLQTATTSSHVISPETVKELSSLWPEDKSKGEVLHCVSVSQMCFKLGRVTVPPALVFSGAGLGLQNVTVEHITGSQTGDEQQRARVAWNYLRTLRSKPKSTNTKNTKGASTSKVSSSTPMQDLMRGGWRDVPVNERWWDQAMAPYEEGRKERLKVVEGLVKVMKVGF